MVFLWFAGQLVAMLVGGLPVLLRDVSGAREPAEVYIKDSGFTRSGLG